MSALLGFLFFALYHVALSKNFTVEPEYLEMLRATGQDEEFARIMGLDVSLVRPQEVRSEEELMYTKVSPLGDILLTPEQEEQARQGLLFSRYPSYRWPNARIPYVISGSDFTSRQRTTIVNAINAFNQRTSRVKVVPRDKESDYVMVISGNGCWSKLGREGGEQTLSLQSNGCLRTGTIQHEFIHAAGFTHEHNRPDRDNYVRVIWDNIPQDWHSQYEKGSTRVFGNQEQYDYYSVMHYGMRAPGTGEPAFEIYDKSIDTSRIGQRQGPTDTDVKKVDTLYS